MNILFYISKLYSIPIFKPCVSEAKRRNINYYFYVSRKVRNNFPEQWETDKILDTISETKNKSIDFTLCPGNYVDYRIPGRKVQIFHGLGVEKQSHYIIRGFFDIYCTSGPYVTQRFEKLSEKHGYFNVIETGWPKVDYILNFDTKDLHQKLDIAKNKKIILFAPTFSTKMESASDLIDIIPDFIRDDEFWIFKFHEFMNSKIISRFKDLLPENSRILKKGDITPYLHLADIMISDTSSVVYEFMILNKPVLTYKAIFRKEKTQNIEDRTELRTNLDSLLLKKEIDYRSNSYLQEVNPYFDGKTSIRIFDELQNIKKNNIRAKKKKPLNLYRKLQILYASFFKKGYLR